MANILVVDQFALMGGAQRILLDLAEGLGKAGHRVTALFPSPGPIREELNRLGVETGDYYLLPMTSGKKSLSEQARYFATIPKTTKSILAAARKQRYDLLYINGPRAALPAVNAARSAGLPAVIAVHLIHRGRALRLLAKCAMRSEVKLVTFCSSHAAAPLKGIGEKGKILPNWVSPRFLEAPRMRDAARTNLNIGNDEIAVGVLGRVSKTKGQRLLIEAALPILDADPSVRLLFAGGADFEDPEEERNLKAEYAPRGRRILFADKTDPVE
ncbi:MAG TPA: glycosyltransferase family 4 protein, partial [Fimbriimonadaceae bacterium]|nr:glycosyltransferase family 4 protein [Fimbriimonadaceae bacterium]